MLFVARLARLVLGGGLMGGGGEVLVASSSAASTSYQEAIAGLGEIVQYFAGVGIVDDRSDGYRQFDRLTLFPGPIAAFAVPAALRGVLGIKPEMKQRIVVRASHHRDVATTAAVAAARPSARHVFLATEGQTPVPAIPGFYADFNFVDKHVELLQAGGVLPDPRTREKPETRNRSANRLDADKLAGTAAVAKHHDAGDFCEQRVVLAQADIIAGLKAGAALTHQDGTAGYHFSAEGFDAQALR